MTLNRFTFGPKLSHRLHVPVLYVFSTNTKIILFSAPVIWPLIPLERYMVQHVHDIPKYPLYRSLETHALVL
jgi:hypothetical protein